MQKHTQAQEKFADGVEPKSSVPLSLAELQPKSAAVITKVASHCRGKKKFADVGIVAGAEIRVESCAPFGGLMRVKIHSSHLSLHSSDARHIAVKKVLCG